MSDVVEKEGCIVILDALGTKGRWKKDTAKNIIDKWELIVNGYIRRFKDTKNKHTNFSKINAFSDTIMIATAGPDKVDNFLKTSIAVSFLTADAFIHDIFFRGGIGVGKYYWSESLLIGSTVDEVAQYYMLPEWIGISATPKAHNILKNMTHEKFHELHFPADLFVKYDIPIKNGVEKNGYALNLPQAYEHVRKNKGLSTRIENPPKIESILDNQLEKTDEITASFKIRNTLEFFKTIPKQTSEELSEKDRKKANNVDP